MSRWDCETYLRGSLPYNRRSEQFPPHQPPPVIDQLERSVLVMFSREIGSDSQAARESSLSFSSATFLNVRSYGNLLKTFANRAERERCECSEKLQKGETIRIGSSCSAARSQASVAAHLADSRRCWLLADVVWQWCGAPPSAAGTVAVSTLPGLEYGPQLRARVRRRGRINLRRRPSPRRRIQHCRTK